MALGWLWWRTWFPWTTRPFVWQAWHLATSTFTLMRDALSANEPSSSCYPTSNASEESVTLPHEQWYNGCPVAPLDVLQVDAQLGLISVGEVEASFVRCLVAFNDAQLADDETLQQDLTSTSAMRVKCSVDCLYCLLQPPKVSRAG